MSRLALRPPARGLTLTAMGTTQILAWGSSFYLPAVLAVPISTETGWSLASVVAGLSVALLVAGLSSPSVGRVIKSQGGRPVLAASSLFLATGLLTLASAHHLAVFYLAWLLIGAGMSAGLYDAAFASVARLDPQRARAAITTLTLFGGFASTVCWPLSAYLAETLGWRGACLTYGLIHLLVCLPLHLLLVPSASGDRGSDLDAPSALQSLQHRPGPAWTFALLATILTIAALISSMLSVHLLTIFQLRGFDLAAAVAMGALVGPAQVGGRIFELAVGRKFHPAWTMLASVALVAAGVILLFAEAPLPAIALIFYGAGNGLHTIARGALPLVLFDPAQYAVLMGRLALPSLLMQAVAPSIGAGLLGMRGGPMLLLLGALAAFNVALCVILARSATYAGTRHRV